MLHGTHRVPLEVPCPSRPCSVSWASSSKMMEESLFRPTGHSWRRIGLLSNVEAYVDESSGIFQPNATGSMVKLDLPTTGGNVA